MSDTPQIVQSKKVMGMTSWRTTLIGLAAVVAAAVYPLLMNGDFELKRDMPKVVGAAFLALIGSFAKDKNVTGGTIASGDVPQNVAPPEPKPIEVDSAGVVLPKQ